MSNNATTPYIRQRLTTQRLVQRAERTRRRRSQLAHAEPHDAVQSLARARERKPLSECEERAHYPPYLQAAMNEDVQRKKQKRTALPIAAERTSLGSVPHDSDDGDGVRNARANALEDCVLLRSVAAEAMVATSAIIVTPRMLARGGMCVCTARASIRTVSGCGVTE